MATFTGTTGNDVANGSSGTLTGFTGGTLAELQDATGDTFNASSGLDTIVAGAGADTINGGDGDDVIAGRAGVDSINGGNGFDEARYDFDAAAGGGAGVTVNLSAGTAIDGFGNTDTLVSIEAARGTAQADTFTGNAFDNEFRGLGGNDTFDGGAGFDVLRYDSDQGAGGAAGITANFTGVGSGTVTDGFGATDTFTGIEGIRATAFVDVLNGFGAGSEEFFGLAGNDTLNGGNGAGFDWARYDRDSIYGGNGGVTANLATGIATDGFGNTDTLIGIEALRGTAVADTFTGDGNRNGFVGGAGNDTMNGGDGFDFVSYNSNSESGAFGVNVNLATGVATDTFGNTDTISNIEEVFGSNLGDTLAGSNLSENLFGNNGSDSLVGSGGGDFMRGGAGNDTLNGTAGVGSFADMSNGDRDWAAYNDGGIFQGVTVNLDTGIATDGFGNTDTLIDIERVRGTNFADSITGSNTQNLRNERFEGLGGNDTINGQAGFDQVSYQNDASNGGAAGVTVNLTTGVATDGFGATDTLSNIEGVIGTGSADSLTGNTANNYFRLVGGNDTVDGGSGIDTIDLYFDDQIGGAGSTVNLATGTGTLASGGAITFTSIEAVDGSYRNDTITGGTGADNLFGDLGNDSIDGGDGDDTVSGGAGADTLVGGIGNDWVGWVFDTTFPAQAALDAAANAQFGWLTQNWVWTGVTANLATGVMSGADGAVDTFSGFENLFGTYLNDSLTGDGNDNRFRGYSGNDTIDGGGGSDTVVYSKTVSRASGLVIASMTGDNPLNINVNLSTGVALDGNGGTDTLTNIENVVGGEGNDTMVGNASVNTFTGGLGNDDYTIEANDIVVELASEGTDTIRVNFGTVTIASNVENVVFLGYSGATNVLGNAENNSVIGTSAVNVMNGGGGADTLVGGALADVIIGGTGADSMTGGDGGDSYYVDDANDVIVEGSSVSSGYDIVTVTNGNYVLSANIEQAGVEAGGTGVTGNAGANFLYGGNSGLSLSLNGGDGDDILFAGLAGGNTLVGGDGVDTLLIYGGNNQANGGLGSDIYYTYTATDVLSEAGGSGIDTVYSTHSITLGDGFEQILLSGSAVSAISTSLTDNNIIYGNSASGAVSLDGGGGSDVLFGGTFNDTLVGGAGVDLLFGQGGNNTLIGGDDTDIYYIDAAGSTITETLTGGFDTMYSQAAGITVMAANVEQLILYGAATGGTGTSGNDYLYGNASGNALTLDGGGGADYLLGSAQNDTLIGGSGNDGFALSAGGVDRILYNAAGNMGADTAYNFDAVGNDLIDLSGQGYAAGSIGGAITIASFGGGTLVSFVSGSLAGTTLNLTGVAVANVTAADFVF